MVVKLFLDAMMNKCIYANHMFYNVMLSLLKTIYCI